MNIISNWWQRRRQRIQAEQDAAKAKDAAELADNEKRLRESIKKVKVSLAMVGIRPCDHTTRNTRFTVAEFICVGPDDKPYRAEVTHTGCYSLPKTE